jgi:pSer/pThr/pTyr-binding forkhead associated (FHA) protein
VVGERTLLLREGDNIVGREPGVDVWIDAPSVSRRHACVRVSGAGVTVEDLGSKNGTFVGDEPVTGATPVANGGEIRFGSARAICRQTNCLTT